ncbi:hypothetical protein AAG570_001538 [Ranatra chinensis]|uniref:Intraflagellar transport protein 81 homolog n=1 Tax=Ranatra chinensis TaxID=642074 RepID=A0ABD0Y8T8_9HEMI
MSETVRTIIAALNREPFNKNYTPMTFDALSPEDLLQVLTDVLAEMDEDHRIEIRKEEPEETIVRFLTMLRVLRYSPGPDPVSFRQGLVQGEKEVVYPILEWLLNNLDELKTRAYLGKYLVKVDVPLEVLSNPEISALYKQHLQLLEEFKTLHKTMLEQKAQVANVEEMRFDIEVMQEEKDMLIKKTERLQRKVN